MIKNEKIKIKIYSRNILKYRELYNNLKIGDFVEIDIDDLPKGSHMLVDVVCDVCGKEKQLSYKEYNRNLEQCNYYACSTKCAWGKNKITNLERYGDENYNNREKCKETKFKNHGDENFVNTNKTKKQI